MEKRNNVLESLITARFQDCDPFGHLNNVRYIEYLMDARQNQITDHYNIKFMDKERGTSGVVSQLQIAYFRPVDLFETIKIKTQLIYFDRNKQIGEGAFFSEKGGKLKALSWLDLTYVDIPNERKAEHSDVLLQLYRRIVVKGIFSSQIS